ncbi:MAG: tRNA epoxyqueuosine(34) reductase QueG [Pseudomonadales bacterium]|nr:tRNA epoxyqueuosine(34) reductase QueG [Pseudomonadales bacterium]
MSDIDFTRLAEDIKDWSKNLGFQETAITDVDLSEYDQQLRSWIGNKYHGDMDYMGRNNEKRCDPGQLVPGTIRVICVRMDYAMEKENSFSLLQEPNKAYISRYARGRDYHKLIRKRLQQLAEKIEQVAGKFGYRAFVDSAPVLERALAEKSGLGWIGKNTMLLNKEAGSWFFLGELFTDLPLPVDEPVSHHCGSCTACMDVCPTNAFVESNVLDARRCISYLTIELRESIPEEFRIAMGNRVFGCDDCQLICPWNKFTQLTDEDDFKPRHNFNDIELTKLFLWSESEFLNRTAGSAIRRIGYACWRRNIAIALGNAESTGEVISALRTGLDSPSAMVREHVEWALRQHQD